MDTHLYTISLYLFVGIQIEYKYYKTVCISLYTIITLLVYICLWDTNIIKIFHNRFVYYYYIFVWHLEYAWNMTQTFYNVLFTISIYLFSISIYLLSIRIYLFNISMYLLGTISIYLFIYLFGIVVYICLVLVYVCSVLVYICLHLFSICSKRKNYLLYY